MQLGPTRLETQLEAPQDPQVPSRAWGGTPSSAQDPATTAREGPQRGALSAHLAFPLRFSTRFPFLSLDAPQTHSLHEVLTVSPPA